MEKPIYTINKIAEILSAEASIKIPDYVITQLLTDTRLILQPESALFLTLDGHRDGHSFISDAYQKGVRNFLISESKYLGNYPDANFLRVENVLEATEKPLLKNGFFNYLLQILTLLEVPKVTTHKLV